MPSVRSMIFREDISPISVDDFVLVDENGDTVSMSDFEGGGGGGLPIHEMPGHLPSGQCQSGTVEQELGDLHGSSVQILMLRSIPGRTTVF